MSGFLEGLVRRGAGLAPAPGEQAAALRPLSRFEQRPFEAAHAEPGIAEIESFATAAPPEAARGDMPGEQPTPVRAAASPVIEQQQKTRARPPRVTSREAALPQIGPSHDRAAPLDPPRHAAALSALPQPLTAHDGPEPAQEPSRNTEFSATATVLRVRETIIEAPQPISSAAPPPVPSAAAPLPFVPSTPPYPAEAPRIETGPSPVPPTTPQNRVNERALVPSQRDLAPFEIETSQAPQLSISIGRIEVDFGQRPAPPPPAPGPQRTRGFEAFARARRGQLR